MIRPKLSLRRSAAIIGAAFLGLGTVVTFAAPASAHHPEINGTYCVVKGSNNYEFKWTVGNSENIKAEVTQVRPGPAGDIKVGAELNPRGGAPLTGTETRTAPSARQLEKTLTVEAKWIRPDRIVIEHRTVKAVDKGKCKT
ncbi:cell wall anchor protein, partial [Plantactinospora sp. S1510]|nr:cell wall anchor protein [Plantactinospora alkalitolerans]